MIMDGDIMAAIEDLPTRYTMALVVGGRCSCCHQPVNTTSGCLRCSNRSWDGDGRLLSCSCGFVATPTKKEKPKP